MMVKFVTLDWVMCLNVFLELFEVLKKLWPGLRAWRGGTVNSVQGLL